MITPKTRNIARKILRSIGELQMLDIHPDGEGNPFDRDAQLRPEDRREVESLVNETANLYAALLLHKQNPDLGFDQAAYKLRRKITIDLAALLSPEEYELAHTMDSGSYSQMMNKKREDNVSPAEEITEKIVGALNKEVGRPGRRR